MISPVEFKCAFKGFVLASMKYNFFFPKKRGVLIDIPISYSYQLLKKRFKDCRCGYGTH